jgi:pyruvate/2-oxoglutarate dehydrogenase complex dihydrolipoamide dehydrogenase (E3) component
MAIDRCQNLVIGSGGAGKFIAWTLAPAGQKTIVVEKGPLGGACPNVACLPSKNIVFSAKVASLMGLAAGLGLAKGPGKVDMAAVFRRKQEMVEALGQMHRDNFQNSGAELVMGEARFAAPKTVVVNLKDGGTRELQGDRVFLNLGTRASRPDEPGLADANPMTHVENLNLQRLPQHLAVLGGGYVGLEFAQAMRRFGSRVTVIDNGERLLGREDPDVSAALLELLRDEGVEVVLGAKLLKVSGRSGESVQLQLRTGSGTSTVEASDILVATGRTPNTDRLDAAKGGVELDARGFIRVDERLRTTAPDTWALGECAGSPQFTHVSYDDFCVVRDNLAGRDRTTRIRLIPYVLFTDPELAHVGLTETDAAAKGIPYRLAKIPMAAVLRTWTISEKRGFAKALIGTDDRILGFTAFGAEASELMAGVQTAMLGGLPYTVLRDGIFTHPTTSEGLTVLFGNVPDKPAARQKA